MKPSGELILTSLFAQVKADREEIENSEETIRQMEQQIKESVEKLTKGSAE